jgi:hypothetical protein
MKVLDAVVVKGLGIDREENGSVDKYSYWED